MIYWWVGIAGGLGAVARFAISRLIQHLGWVAFPYSTLAVNVLGSLLIGYFAISLQSKWGASDQLKIIMLTGFLGGFTTFSAFSLETIEYMEQGALFKSALYVSVTVMLCLTGCLVGYFLAKNPLN